MATKINTDYYGAENTFVPVTGTGITGNVKTCANNLRQLGYNETYTGGSLDLSASPWGIGESSLSSCMYGMLLNNGTNRISINEHFNAKKNNPFFIYENSSGRNSQDLAGSEVTSDNLRRTIVKSRLNPQVTFTNSEIQSAITFDNNENIGNSLSSAKPVTYFNYNKSRLLADVVYFIRENSYTIEHDFLVNFLLHPDDFSNVKYVLGVLMEGRFEYGTQGQLPTSGNWVNFSPSIGGAESDIPEFYKSCYYGDDNKWVRPNRQLLNIGYWKISNYWSLTQLNYGSSPITTNESDMETPKTNFNCSDYNNFFGQVSRKRQEFTDVSYHWELKYLWSSTPYANIDDRIELINGDIMPNTGAIAPFCYLEIDDTTYSKPALAYFYALIHECCFMGLPVIANRYDSTYDIGQSAWIFLPKFDEHLVTTGEFVRSNNASAPDLVNYAWGDVFGTSMPEYDPDYQPPEPTPSDDDYGYLNNKATTNRVYSSNNRVYALTESQYNQFIKDINSLYLNDADGFEKFQLDFKGTNPTDYIVGSYGYTFLPAGLIPGQTAESIEIGAVTLPNAQGYRIAPAYIYNYKALGQIDLTGAGLYKPFGDFRDFEPYTSIELYVPLCGNIKLDPATVVGHTIQIEIRFDIMTGNATACVYRDNSTLIATIAGQLAANLPLSAGRMGDYQNAIKQSENALKQNELKTATAAATVAIGVGAALLAPETGGLSLAAYGAAVAGASSLMSLSNQKNEIEYEITHKQPSISVCSAANGAVAQNISSMYAVCYIKQCKMMSTYNAETYAHTIGHACVINSTIADQVTASKNSFIKCGNVDLSGISATASEISAIQSLLTSGIYV